MPIIIAIATEPIKTYEETTIDIKTIILTNIMPGKIDFKKFKLLEFIL
jgi:hypothetical protein